MSKYIKLMVIVKTLFVCVTTGYAQQPSIQTLRAQSQQAHEQSLKKTIRPMHETGIKIGKAYVQYDTMYPFFAEEQKKFNPTSTAIEPRDPYHAYGESQPIQSGPTSRINAFEQAENE
jgi:hypothetical protein